MSHSPIWHPFTQHAVFPESVFIDRAEGAYLFTKSGERIIDAHFVLVGEHPRT